MNFKLLKMLSHSSINKTSAISLGVSFLGGCESNREELG